LRRENDFFRKITAIAILMAAAIMIISCGNDDNSLSGPTYINPVISYTVGFSSQFKDTIRAVTPPSFTSITVNEGKALGSLPTDPVMEGYKFGGWYEFMDGYGTNITKDTKIYKNMVVYAYWYNYQVLFKNDGKIYASRGVGLPEKTVRTMPPEPTKSGYKFAGWWYWDDATQKNWQFFNNTEVNRDITAEARWVTQDKYVYAITYDSQRGNAVGVQYITSDSPEATVAPDSLPPAPTRLFYDFNGWWTGAGGSNDQPFTENTVVTGNMTVYAHWTEKPTHYTVIYNSYGGTDVESQYVFFPATTVTALPQPPEKPCYTFAGWYTQPEGEGDAFTGTSTVDESTTVDGVITVYAKWTWNPSAAPTTFAIGDRGPSCVGKVFYIDEGSGDAHGLEMAPPDWYLSPDRPTQNTDPESPWITGTPEVDEWGETVDKTQTTLNGKTSTALGTGLQNSQAIVAQSGHVDSAAHLCLTYTGGGFQDWYLPSKEELALMFANRDVKRSGGFYDDDNQGYWSSSESDAWDSWSQYFITGKQIDTSKGYGRLVRPIRHF